MASTWLDTRTTTISRLSGGRTQSTLFRRPRREPITGAQSRRPTKRAENAALDLRQHGSDLLDGEMLSFHGTARWPRGPDCAANSHQMWTFETLQRGKI